MGQFLKNRGYTVKILALGIHEPIVIHVKSIPDVLKKVPVEDSCKSHKESGILYKGKELYGYYAYL